MQLSSNQSAIVILDGSEPPAGLARAAVRNGWPIHRAMTSRGLVGNEFWRGRSRVVLIHVPIIHDEMLPIIRSLKSSRRCAVIVAVSGAADEDAEIRARVAGADFFLPASSDVEVIERTVRAVLAPAEPKAFAPASGPFSNRPVPQPFTRNPQHAITGE